MARNPQGSSPSISGSAFAKASLLLEAVLNHIEVGPVPSKSHKEKLKQNDALVDPKNNLNLGKYNI